MKDLRTEVISLIYEKPIYPKNLWLKRKPMHHATYKTEVIDCQIGLMQERGIFTAPARGAGAKPRTSKKQTVRSKKQK